MKKSYLIFDLGTGNSRIALLTPEGDIIAIHRFDNIYYQDSTAESAKYFIPEEWFEKLLSGAKLLIQENPEYQVIAVSATSAREGIVLIDPSGKAFLGLPNIDRRGVSQTQYQQFSDEIYHISGHWLDPLFSALKLSAYRESHPEQYSNITAFTSLSEWIGYELTGKVGITASQACETQLFDTASYCWSERLCSIYNIDPSILPEVYTTGAALGHLKSSLRQTLNLTEDAAFIMSGADTQTAVRGVHAQSGDVVIVSGTTSPLVTLLQTPLHDKKERCWLDCGLDKDWLIETNAGTTGLNYQTYRNRFLADLDYTAIEDSIAAKDDFKCIASFGTKHFSHKKTLRHGGFLTSAPYSTLQLDHYDYLKALLADIACGITLHYEDLCKITPHQKPYIIGCGGGLQSRFLGQWIADLTGKELILPNGFSQASLRGCLDICNQASGILPNSAYEKTVIYPKENPALQDYYQKWQDFRNTKWVLGD